MVEIKDEPMFANGMAFRMEIPADYRGPATTLIWQKRWKSGDGKEPIYIGLETTLGVNLAHVIPLGDLEPPADWSWRVYLGAGPMVTPSLTNSVFMAGADVITRPDLRGGPLTSVVDALEEAGLMLRRLSFRNPRPVAMPSTEGPMNEATRALEALSMEDRLKVLSRWCHQCGMSVSHPACTCGGRP